MQIAGVPIPDADILELAGLLGSTGFADLAARLEDAWEVETRLIALTVPEREMVLRALADAPTDALAELRATLLGEHEWRVREGLVDPA